MTVDEPSWFRAHQEELVAVGAIALLGLAALVLAPETGGGSLVSLEEAGALAP